MTDLALAPSKKLDTVQPTWAGMMASLRLPSVPTGFEAAYNQLTPDEQRLFATTLQNRVAAIRRFMHLRSFGDSASMTEADRINEESIAARDSDAMQDIFARHPSLRTMFLQTERQLLDWHATQMGPRQQTDGVIAYAAIIRSHLQGQCVDVRAIVAIMRQARPEQLPAIRAALRQALGGPGAADDIIDTTIDGHASLTDEQKEILRLALHGRFEEIDAAYLADALTSNPTTDLERATLWGDLRMQLDGDAAQVGARVDALNRSLQRHELLIHWLQQVDPERAFAYWSEFGDNPGSGLILMNRWMRDNMSEDEINAFNAHADSELASGVPDHFRNRLVQMLGAGSRIPAWIDAMRAGNGDLASAIEMVEAATTLNATPREIMVTFYQMDPEERQRIIAAYAAAYSNPGETGADALHRALTGGAAWNDRYKELLRGILNGTATRNEIDRELVIDALGFNNRGPGGRININAIDFNRLLMGRRPEECQALMAEVETELRRRGILTGSQTLQDYIRTHSAEPPRQAQVWVLRQETSDELRRLANIIQTQSGTARQNAIAALERLTRELSDNSLRESGGPSGHGHYQSVTMTTINRGELWARFVDNLSTYGATEEGRVLQFITRVGSDDTRSDTIMQAGTALSESVDVSRIQLQGAAGNLRTARDAREDVYCFGRRSNPIVGFFAAVTGMRGRVNRSIVEAEDNLARRAIQFADSCDAARRAVVNVQSELAAFQRAHMDYVILELRDNLGALKKQSEAQGHINEVMRRLDKCCKEDASSRIKLNNEEMALLKKCSADLEAVSKACDTCDEVIIKGAVIGVTVATGGAGGIVAGGVVSCIGRGTKQLVRGRGFNTGQFAKEVLGDVEDAALCVVAGGAGTKVTASALKGANTTKQIVWAHVKGNATTGLVNFTGNTAIKAQNYTIDCVSEGKDLFDFKGNHKLIEKHGLRPCDLMYDVVLQGTTSTLSGTIAGGTHRFHVKWDKAAGAWADASKTTKLIADVVNVGGQISVDVGSVYVQHKINTGSDNWKERHVDLSTATNSIFNIFGARRTGLGSTSHASTTSHTSTTTTTSHTSTTGGSSTTTTGGGSHASTTGGGGSHTSTTGGGGSHTSSTGGGSHTSTTGGSGHSSTTSHTSTGGHGDGHSGGGSGGSHPTRTDGGGGSHPVAHTDGAGGGAHPTRTGDGPGGTHPTPHGDGPGGTRTTHAGDPPHTGTRPHGDGTPGSKWGTVRAVGGATLKYGSLAVTAFGAAKAYEQFSKVLGMAWDGMEGMGEGDLGYMYGRTDDPGMDQRMYEACQAHAHEPQRWAEILHNTLRETYGGVIPDDELEELVRRLIPPGRTTPPTQQELRQLIRHCNALMGVTFGTNEDPGGLLEGELIGKGPVAPHGGVGLYDIEKLKASGLILPTYK